MLKIYKKGNDIVFDYDYGTKETLERVIRWQGAIYADFNKRRSDGGKSRVVLNDSQLKELEKLGVKPV